MDANKVDQSLNNYSNLESNIKVFQKDSIVKHNSKCSIDNYATYNFNNDVINSNNLENENIQDVNLNKSNIIDNIEKNNTYLSNSQMLDDISKTNLKDKDVSMSEIIDNNIENNNILHLNKNPIKTENSNLANISIDNVKLKRSSSTNYNYCTQKFYVNNNYENSKHKPKYFSNKVSTSKYNIFTFLPKALLFQFYRLANVYFLFIAIIQSIPIISPLVSATSLAPLIFVISVSLVREGIEDYIRHKYDTKLNNQRVKVYKDGVIETVKSRSLKVGEVILLESDDQIPCDILLIDTSLPGGSAYIETATLDGEKTLKNRIASKVCAGSIFKNNNKTNNKSNINLYPEYIMIKGTIEREKPNNDLHSFNGSMSIEIYESLHNNNFKTFPSTAVDINNLVLRGSILKNTPYAIGVIVYTGHHTKLMLNSKKSKVKYSELEKVVSKLLIAILVLQVFLCIIAAALLEPYHVYNIHPNNYMPRRLFGYIPDSVINYFSYTLLLNTMIPISLIITIEIVKIIQGYFISRDVKGYSFVKKHYIKAGSISLNEELGNINFIFSDKTGTLTCNNMKFKYGIINNKCYNFEESSSTNKNNVYSDQNINTIKLDDTMTIEPKINSLKDIEKRNEYFTILSLTHECESKLIDNNSYEYLGASPDDIELVKTANLNGFCFLPNTNPNIRSIKVNVNRNILDKDSKINNNNSNNNLNENYEVKDYIVEAINQFDSKRKRMSIILKDNNGNFNNLSNNENKLENKYVVYIKGADSEINKRLLINKKKLLAKDCIVEDNKKKYDNVCRYVSYFSNLGLRVLMLAKKTINEKQLETYKKKINEAGLDIVNKSKLIEEVVDEFEQDFELIGATVVEDKLQDEVPETIMKLKLAGIKIWMLTGDAVDTAKKIGLSCNLINPREKVFEILDGKETTINNFFIECNDYINHIIKDSQLVTINNIFLNKETEEINKKIEHEKLLNNNNNLKIAHYSIVVSSEALYKILSSDKTNYNSNNKDNSIKNRFLNIACNAKSVIACRVSPIQKANIVKEMKIYDSKAKTLSIGDGGNDVSMILEANVGIGIYGEEGMRAVQASDYAIGEFKILQRLLFFHGRISLLRISKLIYYFFYKNFIFTMAHFFFIFISNSSAQSIYEDWFITFYNLIYTAFPIGILACSEIDIREEDGILVERMQPFIYSIGRDNPLFTKFKFIVELIKAFILSGIFFVIIYFSLYITAVSNYNIADVNANNGYQADLWSISYVYFTSILMAVSFVIFIQIRYITLIFVIVLILTSWVIYFLTLVWFNNSSSNSSGTYFILLVSLRPYLIIILNTAIGGLVEYAVKSYSILLSPSIIESISILRYNKNPIIENINNAIKVETYANYLERYNENLFITKIKKQ